MRRPRFPTRAYEDRVEPTIRMRITRCRRIDDRTGHNAMTGCTGTFALAWLRSADASDLFGVNQGRHAPQNPRQAWECPSLCARKCPLPDR